MSHFRNGSGRAAAVVFALCLGIVACGQAPAPEPAAPAPAPDRAADEAAIRAVIARAATALSARDFAAWAADFSTDGDSIVKESGYASGRTAIQSQGETGWAALPADRMIAIEIDRIRFLGNDVALVDNTATFSDGSPGDRGFVVLVRQEGTWRTSALRVLPAEAQ